MGLVELGKHTGFSAAMLSKLERGKPFPALPALLRIALVFGVGLEYFFTDERLRTLRLPRRRCTVGRIDKETSSLFRAKNLRDWRHGENNRRKDYNSAGRVFPFFFPNTELQPIQRSSYDRETE
jgi:transcriptional regulator with XRE-family HTH domain